MPDTDAESSVWAKSTRDGTGHLIEWLPLHQHSADAAAVAELLVQRWVSPQVMRRIARDVPDGTEGVRAIARWLAAVHDVGKASPAFACQVAILADRMRARGFVMHPRLADDGARRVATHALVGHWAVREWLARELGFAFTGSAAQWASVVGSHHGVTPEETQLAAVATVPHLTGTGSWADARRTLLTRAATHTGGAGVLRRYADIDLSLPTQVLLTAIVIIADWIASDSSLFPLLPASTAGHEPDETVTTARTRSAWTALNLPAGWVSAPGVSDADRLFRERFDTANRSARPMQRAVVAAAWAQSEPGMLIVEAPMGSGKTEAALMAAEILAYRSGADGVFLALPTQATTDAMYDRVHAWLSRLPGGQHLAVSLVHGKAHLHDSYRERVHHGQSRAPSQSRDSAIAHGWLSTRGIPALASFVVGTIEQVLFGALKSRHAMLRHLALAGKVVIIDEVHAYDVYMSQYLHRMLHWLGNYGVPVVLLSATLPDERRAELLRAYDSGRTSVTALPSRSPGYPVVSGSGGLTPQTITSAGTSTEIALDHLSDDQDTLVAYLRRHLRDGGCAAVVRNTIGRVQATAERLIAEFGADMITITHARFLACDRSRIDTDLVRRFGPPDSAPNRPTRHIVVGSQVIEQSLDVDFDLMITDLAPTDLILQRLGRLHRHRRPQPRPPGVGTPRCALVGVTSWSAVPVTAVHGSRHVYSEHLLLRSAALLTGRDSLRLPDDIATLVRLGYNTDPLGPPEWQDAMNAAVSTARAEAQRRADYAKAFLVGTTESSDTLVGWLSAGVGNVHEAGPKAAAQVRDGAQSVEVLAVHLDIDGGLRTPSWVPGGGELIPPTGAIPGDQARLLAACALRLPAALSHGRVIDPVIAELKKHRFANFDLNPILAGQLVLPFDADRRASVQGFTLTYDLRRGLVYERA